MSRTKEPRSVIAENLRRLRERHGLSQEQLADALRASEVLDWTQATIADLELGQRHLRADEALALALFFRIGPEMLLAPQRGQVTLGTTLAVDLDTLLSFLRTRKPKSVAMKVLPRGRGVEAYSRARQHAPMTPRLEGELEEWRAAGGNPAELRRKRDRLWSGSISPQQFAAWKRHASARLRAGASHRSLKDQGG